MVLIQNYMFGGDNSKRKLGLDMLLLQNLKKIDFTKTYEVFLKPSKTIAKSMKNLRKNIVP